MQGKHPRLQGPIFCPIASQRTGTEIAPLYGKLFRPKPLCLPAGNSQRGLIFGDFFLREGSSLGSGGGI